MCLCVCLCGHCNGKQVKVAVYRFLKEETRSCHHLRRANYRALKLGNLKTRKTVASKQQMKFHGAMMRQIRNVLNEGYIDDGPETTKALKYVRKLKNDSTLQQNIAEGLIGDFSIQTDLKYIDKVLELEASQRTDSGDTSPLDERIPHHSECEPGEMRAEEEDFDFRSWFTVEEWSKIMRDEPAHPADSEEDDLERPF
jgi:hypothetical protein